MVWPQHCVSLSQMAHHAEGTGFAPEQPQPLTSFTHTVRPWEGPSTTCDQGGWAGSAVSREAPLGRHVWRMRELK